MCSKMSKFVENAEKTAKFCENSVNIPELLQLFIHADWIIQSSPYLQGWEFGYRADILQR